MAVVQSALLTFGTFVGVLWFFAQLPEMISKWQAKELSKMKLRPLLLAHFAHLMWMVYAIQKWDYDWFIPSLLQTIVSLGHLALIYTLLRMQAKVLAQYALAVPLALLVIWRAAPVWLAGGLAMLLQIVSEVAYTWSLADVRAAVGANENSKYSCLLRLIQCLIWAVFGHLRGDFFITSAFLVGSLLTASEQLQQTFAHKRPKKE